ncbi:hypothetical protein ACIBJF_47570 [Streptomyces sp. NPDC050743]|uniref:hypothetical protein n=1 Tax=Streptomyces sp. NPDC050743 TaxID=3365634 RepID=UPI0037B417D1
MFREIIARPGPAWLKHEGAPGPRDRRRRCVGLSVTAVALLLLGGGAYGLWASKDGGGTVGAARTAEGSATPSPVASPTFPPLGVSVYGPPAAVGTPASFPDITYRAAGPLSKATGSAAVYRSKGAVTAAEATRLADALGVGTLRLARQTWTTGASRYGRWPEADLGESAPGGWNYKRWASGGTDRCEHRDKCEYTRSGGALPSDRLAKSVALPVFRKLGLGNAKVTVRRQEWRGATEVRADPVVDGLPTVNWDTRLVINGDGRIVEGSGLLRLPVKDTEYALIDADDAVQQLNAAQPAHTATSGKQLVEATVDGAHLVLATATVRHGSALAPFWAFDVRGPDGTRSVVMVPALTLDDQFRIVLR